MNKLRYKHFHEEGEHFGVDINGVSGICNTYDAFIWEPALVKINALSAATEAACTILSIDETVRNPKSEQEQEQRRLKKMAPRLGGLGRGRR